MKTENSLQYLCEQQNRMDLLREWDWDKNMPLTIHKGSHQKAWWRCELGHEWQAVIAARVAERSGCPYCAGRRVMAGFNDLATLHPDIAVQWDDALNGTLTPEMVTSGSHKRVWWKCSEGHVWKAAVYSRTDKQKCGCPVCAGQMRRQKKR